MDLLFDFLQNTGWAMLDIRYIIMIGIGILFCYLAIAKEYEPLLLLPIGFGVIIGNIPFFKGFGLGIYEDNSVLHYLYFGVRTGLYPSIVFLGLGAMTDFGPLLENPKIFLLGAAGQFGIFLTIGLALFFGFSKLDAVAIGVIGACDGPTVSTWYPDTDGDGYGVDSTAVPSCAQPPGYVPTGGDCDPLNPDVHPGAAEVNDGLDNQCPGDPGHGLDLLLGGDRLVQLVAVGPARLHAGRWQRIASRSRESDRGDHAIAGPAGRRERESGRAGPMDDSRQGRGRHELQPALRRRRCRRSLRRFVGTPRRGALHLQRLGDGYGDGKRRAGRHRPQRIRRGGADDGRGLAGRDARR